MARTRSPRLGSSQWLLKACTLVISILGGGLVTSSSPVGAAPGDCGFGGATATFTGAPGAPWNVDGNWDTNAQPLGGQICIPAGASVVLPNPMTGVLGIIRVQGTMRITATQVSAQATITNTGRIEVASAASLVVYPGQIDNALGGVVRVESAGLVNVSTQFNNLGGRIDLTGGGTFTLSSGSYVHGDSGGSSPVASDVVGGALQLGGTGAVQLLGSGAAAFAVPPGGNPIVTGTLRANQSVSVQCGGANESYLRVGAGTFRNEGAITFLARASGTTCTAHMDPQAGATVDNAGTITVGEAGHAADPVQWLNPGTVLNESTGHITVRSNLYTNVPSVINDGAIDVVAGASFGFGDTTFVARNGTINNQGSMQISRSSPTYGFSGTFRVLTGTMTGNPMVLGPAYVEFAGPGAATVSVPAGQSGVIRNPGGPIGIGAAQSVIVEGVFDNSGAPMENRGTITLTGTAPGSAIFGSGSAPITNRGRIVLTSSPTISGDNSINAPVINDVGGVIEVQPSARTCNIGGVTNRAVIDLGQTCTVGGVLDLTAATSTLRVRSSATALTALYDARAGTTLGGTLEVVPNPTSPPVVGAARDLVVGRCTSFCFTVINGSFAKVVGGQVAPNLGHGLVYTTTYPRTAQLQVTTVNRLAVAALTAPATAIVGDDVAVSWTTHVDTATSTPWTESVYLSNSPTVDDTAQLLGRVARTGAVSTGADLPASIQVRMPSTTPGSRFLVVVLDSGLGLPMPDRSATTTARPITISPTDVSVGGAGVSLSVGIEGSRTPSPTGATTAPLDGSRLVRLVGDVTQDLLIMVSPAGAVTSGLLAVFGAVGRAPTEADHDATSADGTMLLPHGGERYVLLRNSGGTPVTVTVAATAPGVSITSSSPATVIAGSPAPTPVVVSGTGFTATTPVRLVCGVTVVTAGSVQVDGPTSLSATFALPTALGSCNLEVGTATKLAALAVTPAPVATTPVALEPTIELVVPSRVRSEVDNKIIVKWTNNTAYSIPAPLFTVSTTGGRLRHATNPGLGSGDVLVLGIAPNGPAGVLAPGASGSTTLVLRTDSVAAHTQVNYSYSILDQAAAYVPADAYLALLGADVPAAARAWVAANGPAIVGVPSPTTAGVFERHLGDVATTLSLLGRRIADPAALLAYDLQQITSGSRLEAFTSAEFGAGTKGLQLPKLLVAATSGDVVLVDGVNRIRFAHVATGAYVTPPGIADQLVAVNGGGWVLTSRDGSRRTYSAAGLLTSTTDPDQRTTTFTYSNGRLTSLTEPSFGTTTYAYDGLGRIVAITDSSNQLTTFGYDAGGRLASTTSRGTTSATTWNADNLPISSTGPTGVTVAFTRDPFGRVTQTTVNGALLRSTTYQPDGSISATDALGRTATTWRDDTGAVARLLDPLGRITSTRRDQNGAPIGTLVDGVPVGNAIISDAARSISGTRDGAGGLTAIGLDADGFLTSVTDQDGRTTSLALDAAHRVTAITDPLGRTSRIGYDTAGRQATIVDRTGAQTSTFYGTGDLVSEIRRSDGGIITLAYDSRRNLLSATGPSGTTTFTYDTNDRPASVTYPTGLGLTYTYDNAGRRTTTTTSDGQVFGATYDARGRLATATSNGITVAQYEYDGIDRLTATGFANGTRTEITRDTLGRVARERTTCCTTNGVAPGGTVVTDVQLSYDQRDRVATRTDATGTTTYTYDGDSKLIGAVTVGSAPRTIAWTYDADGNRSTVSDSVSGTLATTSDAAGRPTQIGAVAVTHDAEGRRTSIGTSTYTWDGTSHLVSTTVGGTTTSYTYDALGTPITRSDGATTTRLLIDTSGLGWLVGEYSATNVRQAGYLWGQGVAAKVNGAGTVSAYYSTDPRGDVLALTNGVGAVTDTYRYLPFGEIVARTGTDAQPFQFQGKWGARSDPNGVVGVRARAYDPATGRFLTEDPQLFAAGNPAAWVSNDPMNRTDVSGGEEGFEGQVNADPVGYGLSAFGFNTQGTGISNFFQGVGMVAGMLTSRADATADALYQRGAALAHDAMNIRRGPIEMFQRAVGKVPPALRENFRRTMQASDDLIEESRQFSKTGNRLAKLGLLAGGIQALDNVYQGWSGDPVFDGCNIVRQGLTLGVKTYLARVPGLDLLVDPYFNLIDVGSLNLYQDYFGVDPTSLYTETGWRPPGKRPRPGGKSDNLQSHDPNLMVGPAGVIVGSQRFVARADELPYTILFENAASASLPADRVSVSHTLDANLDLTTFALGAVSIGGRSWNAPPGVRSWTTTLDDTDRSGLVVRLQAHLDVSTRTVTWIFTGLDPTTMGVPDLATRGFLPPNTTAPHGEGSVTYTVRMLTAATTGTTVAAQASIVFDANAAIATNIDTVVADAAAPTATPTVGATSANPVVITLGSTDDVGGSGVASSDVWASQDGAAFTLVGDAIAGTTFSFTGIVGSTYRFVVRPEDATGNRGPFSTPSTTVTVIPPVNPPAADPALGTFTPLTPGRLLDTRDGTGTDGVVAPIGPDSAIELQITGRQGIPTTGVTAVAINMTDVGPTRDGYLTAWPAGVGRPLASNLNFVAGQTRPNAVVVKVGANGKIALYNFAGRTDVVVDVAGYWSDAGGNPGSSYTPITPTRALDTRNGTGAPATPIGPNSSISLTMSGVSAIPSDATGVVLNVIAVDPTRSGFLTVYPTGQPRPSASTHNFGPGVTIANLVFAKLGANRSVDIYNLAGSTDVVADVVGWFGAAGAGGSGRLTPITPARLFDTREASGDHSPLQAGVARAITVAGHLGIPAQATAIIANITAVNPTAPGFFTAWASGAAQPLASNLNFGTGEVLGCLSIVAIGADGTIQLFANAGHVDAVIDVVGYIA